jgi:hypothetical protein
VSALCGLAAAQPTVSLTVGTDTSISSLNLESRPNQWVLTNHRAAGLWFTAGGKSALAITTNKLNLRTAAVAEAEEAASLIDQTSLIQGQSSQKFVRKNRFVKEPNYDEEDFDFALLEMAEQVATRQTQATVFNADRIQATGTFTVTSEQYVIGENPQWNIVQHDDFETPATSAGWSSNETQTCGLNPSRFLGGWCKFSNAEVFKKVTGLSKIPHTKVRIQAIFHFFDKWEGEFAYMKVNDKTVWLEHHNYCRQAFEDYCKGLSICGEDQYADRLATLIDITVDSSDDLVKIAFGSNLGDDPCKASWGVDDVQVQILPTPQG